MSILYKGLNLHLSMTGVVIKIIVLLQRAFLMYISWIQCFDEGHLHIII